MNRPSLKNTFYFIKDFCEDTAENFRETAVTAVDRAKLQYRITAQRKELNAMYASLGKDVYNCLDRKNADALSEEETNALRNRISAKEELMLGLEKQLRIVSGQVICPDCGRFISERYSYCPYCGHKLTSTEFTAETDGRTGDVTEDELALVREIDDI